MHISVTSPASAVCTFRNKHPIMHMHMHIHMHMHMRA